MSQVVEIELPDELPAALQRDAAVMGAELRLAAAVKWYELGLLSPFQRWVGRKNIASVPKGRLNPAMSYVSSYYHCVFSTKERKPLISPSLRERLWPFMGGIARENGMKAVEIGGVDDHVHLLLSLPSTMSISKAMQLIKGGSSKWVHDTFPEHRLFQWQVKYGAFAVSLSLLDKTISYIKNQEKHHRKVSFQEEFLALLRKHRIAFDERYLWE